MANIHMDGFDTYASADLSNRYTNVGGNDASATIVPGGRFGGSCLGLAGFYNANLTNYVTYSGNTLYIGFAWRNVGGGNQATSILNVDGNVLSLDSTGRITVQGPLISSTNAVSYSYSASSVNVPLQGGGWNYFELAITLDPTNGSIQVNVNGLPVAGLTQTGIQTTIGAAPNPCPVSFGSNGSGTSGNASGQFDDWYINDNSGTVNNGLLGDTKIVAYLPSGPGRVTQWTPTNPAAAGENYSCVNQNPADGDTTYVSDSNPGDEDAYVTTALAGQLAGVQAVHSVKITAIARKDDAATRTISVGVGNGSTESFGSPLALGTNYVPVSSIFNTNPITSAPWSVSDVVNLQTAIKEVQ